MKGQFIVGRNCGTMINDKSGTIWEYSDSIRTDCVYLFHNNVTENRIFPGNNQIWKKKKMQARQAVFEIIVSGLL